MFLFNITYRNTSISCLSDQIEDLRERLHSAETKILEWRELEQKAQHVIRELQNEFSRK